ncbi:MAG: AAA family ATPase [Desulfurococcales archaeon]|nr:AAA family ATPase [Desulfurococcales archaeon]
MSEAYIVEHAKRYALAAVENDSKKNYDAAIRNYEAAATLLERAVRLYPDHPLRDTFILYIRKYRNRVTILRKMMIPQGALRDRDDEIYIEDDENQEDDDKTRETANTDTLKPPGFVQTEKPNLTFDEIAGLDDAKQAIREAIIFPIERPDLFPLGWPRGILLFGPPGNGKTMLAAGIANEVDGEFLYVDAASIMSKWLGEGEKNVKRLFKYARAKAETGIPIIIFIDEIDALIGVNISEVGGEVRVRNQFLKEMDGLQDKDKNYHVYVIGATNKPWKLDEPFIRRFQKRIFIPLPDKETREKILELYTHRLDLDSDVNLDVLAEKMEGYSGSDIKDVVQAAYMVTVREFFENRGEGMKPRPVSMKDFDLVLSKRKPSVNKKMLEMYDKWFDEYKAL